MFRKGFAFAIVVLFIGASVVSGLNISSKNNTQPVHRGWLYVGGSGPGNYTHIQDAIDNASDGDTVYVYNGNYYENVIVNKTIDLVGQDRNDTIIDGGGENGNVINISADWVNLNNFTVQNSSTEWSNYGGVTLYITNHCIIENITSRNNDCGLLLISSNNNTILSSYMNSNYDGLKLSFYSSGNNISNCDIYFNTCGIHFLSHTEYNTVKNCNISNNTQLGVDLHGGLIVYNVISNCILSYNGVAVGFPLEYYGCNNNKIIYNKISNNSCGIGIPLPDMGPPQVNNQIYNNQFMNNNLSAYDANTNFWDNGYPSGGNYWSDYNGTDDYYGSNQDIPGSDGIGDTPYTISGGDNQDLYPLMHPFEMYYILQIILPNILIFEGDEFPVLAYSLANLPIPDAFVEFNDETVSTDSNGTAWFTAPQVDTDTYYEINATKMGYTGANETILVKNVPSEFKNAFIFGRITNLSSEVECITFEAVKTRVLTLNPLSFNTYLSGEKFSLSKEYKGFIGLHFMFALCKRLV